MSAPFVVREPIHDLLDFVPFLKFKNLQKLGPSKSSIFFRPKHSQVLPRSYNSKCDPTPLLVSEPIRDRQTDMEQ